ncbi:type I glyceraldehyde-3-phosphate dehydrogenase [Patescibacteria group bacterium]|nr:type I glyceraldehyde-3-phosphate dehydrogenase [Patescibacteria group bacterium]MBU1256781.1 type I glyceraldehyde-3-phosphate dehydrogenase [Patescibacteria group bacterium]MBU1457406.1 type I glyceraldehyde-3-phosphate dehydrogenase [Patescibacteria group bacterium]
MINFSINGFGRIGRSATRVWLESHTDKLNLVAINTSGSLPISGWANLLKYDTAYGRLPYSITAEEVSDQAPLIGFLIIQKPNQVYKLPVLAQRDPEKIPWSKYQADIVIESTGVFTTQEEARKHLTAGAKLVIISAPAKGGSVPTAVIGVNEDSIVGKDRVNSYSIVSNASCTTNCVAPVAAVMHSKIGVLKAMLTTIHGYTDDQKLQDNSHKDMRRARAAAQNIIPTTTGAATATTETIPELKGLFQGLALRVPVITGSITDFTFVTKRTTSVEEVNQIFVNASQSPIYRGVLATTTESLVSSDIIGRPESAIVDLGLTKVVDGTLVKVMAWYDNEYGYANRLVEQVIQAAETI